MRKKHTSPCEIDGCDELARIRMMCKGHYERWRTKGSADSGPRCRGALGERWERYVDRDGPTPEAPYREVEGGCWLWTGTLRNGYGAISGDVLLDGGRLFYAHRLSYQWHVGPIPDGLVVDHVCRVRRCVNPKHLETVTRAENNRRERVWRRRAEDDSLWVTLAAYDAATPRSQQTAIARSENRFGVGPSDIGECRRRIAYRERPPADYEPLPEPPESKAAAIIGSAIHKAVADAVKKRFPHRLVEAAVPIPGFDVPGHLDEYAPEHARVTDRKTVGEYKWEKIADGPIEADFQQVQIYGLGLRELGHPVRTVRIEYIRRSNGATEVFERDYDETAALSAAGWLHAVIDALDEGRELPRDRLGPDFDGICKRCPARAHCWDLDRAAEAGRTAAGWLIARDDEGIASAAAAYAEARDEIKPYVEQKDYTRNLLEGVPPGVYGDWEVRYSKVSDPKPIPDYETRAGLLELHLAEVAAGKAAPLHPEDVPFPTKPGATRSRSIIVKRAKRAAQVEAEARESGTVIDVGSPVRD